MTEIRFRTELGAEVVVPLQGESAREIRRDALRAMREFGRYGWRAVAVPPGGLRFPLASEPDFDWTLLGGRRGTCTVEGEEREGVWYDGQFYTRRELEVNPRMKLARAVKYSRGAKNTDPAEGVEEGDGSFRYVALAVFRGRGGGGTSTPRPRTPRRDAARVLRMAEAAGATPTARQTRGIGLAA